MTGDERDARDGRDAREEAAGRGDRGEPLGDVASKVRERTGEPGGQPRRDGPLADVASAVDERRRKRDTSDAFESVEVGELDGEKLWEQLADGDDATTVPTDVTVPTDADDNRDVYTIPKATCHGCPHFGEPPELHCTHENADILAMPDADHFRVADCPMVDDSEEEINPVAVESDDAGDDTIDGPTGDDGGSERAIE